MRGGSGARGFTLIEVLVALAIVAIGMSAVLSTISSSAATVAYLRDKTFAQWIALNQLAQVRLQTQPPSMGKSDGELDYAGRHWRWQQTVSDLGFPGIQRIDVQVQLADTPQGKDAPWIGSVIGVYGQTLAGPKTISLYQEYQPQPTNVSSSSGSSASLLGSPSSPNGATSTGGLGFGQPLGTQPP
ncbi:MAG TPA: type II secretion system minor pseudopilin GspI [Steroidobacteraceae bacterium]|nr:type II secretion system minor pseudopilin GspI [Steroidobacteraceae bacterium]